ISEFEEIFGKPDIMNVEFHPDLNAEIEYWKYKKKNQQENYLLQAQFNRNSNVIISYMFGLHLPSNEKELKPVDIENLRDKKVQDIKDIYGTPTALVIESDYENLTYRSSISKLEIIIDQETEKVREYSYSYESSDQ